MSGGAIDFESTFNSLFKTPRIMANFQKKSERSNEIAGSKDGNKNCGCSNLKTNDSGSASGTIKNKFASYKTNPLAQTRGVDFVNYVRKYPISF